MGMYLGNGWIVHSSDRGTTLVADDRLVRDPLRLGPKPARRGRHRRRSRPPLAPQARSRALALGASTGLSSPDDVRRRPTTATTACPTAAPAAAGCSSPRSRSGCGGTSATTARSRRAARSSAARSTSASRTSTSRTTTGRRTARRRRTSAGCCARTSSPYRDELVDLDEGRLRHVAGPVRRVGLAQVPAREPRPEPRAHGARLRRHLLLAPLRPGDAARGDDGRARHRRPAGQGAVRGHLLLLGGEDARGGRDPARPRHAAPHPPAVVLDAEPLDRARPPRRARRARRRLHRLLAARAGDAHRPVPGRDPRGLAREPPGLALARPAHRRGAREDPRAERDRRRPRPDASRRWRSPGRSATRA